MYRISSASCAPTRRCPFKFKLKLQVGVQLPSIYLHELTETVSMLFGHGVDVVYLPRLLALVRRRGADRFARRVLSNTEFTTWRTLDVEDIHARVRYLAVRLV